MIVKRYVNRHNVNEPTEVISKSKTVKPTDNLLNMRHEEQNFKNVNTVHKGKAIDNFPKPKGVISCKSTVLF